MELLTVKHFWKITHLNNSFTTYFLARSPADAFQKAKSGLFNNLP